MLELKDVIKYYNDADQQVRAADGINLSISAGEMVALLGPSGSGKSTLLMLIAGLLPLDAGTIRYDDTDLASLSTRQVCTYLLRHVGFVYQRFRLVPRVSAVDNAAQKLLLGGVPLRDARTYAIPWLERVGLTDRLRHPPERLSVGERQRVAIARVLAAEPRLILADEPTGNLDTERGLQIIRLLRSIAHERGASVLLVTHDVDAAAVADRRCILRDGKLTADYPIADRAVETERSTSI